MRRELTVETWQLGASGYSRQANLNADIESTATVSKTAVMRWPVRAAAGTSCGEPTTHR